MPVVSSRVVGWSALVLAVGATIAVVPPLVLPDPRPGAAPVVQQSAGSSVMPPSPLPSPRPPAPSPSKAEPPPTTPRAAASAASRFRPITVHAADPVNIRVGARVIACPSCVDGSRVGYIGGPNTLAVRIAGVPRAGERTLTIVYETELPRTLKFAVDDGPVQELTLAGARSWLIPARVSVRVRLPEGTCWISFFNDAGSAPDIDTVTVS
ncbi:hypothetical protein Cs7R123_04700 [Catellatospora sp. TT07R-123]|uniref:hypothetical protein n=1 Tax=Catellatospora sp. TT07R-123 TaxID=2733863 RepID=UPI001B2B4ADA|nr:hypothetical protein [Catellatospora sp. TT07R-123]GHJ43128.1 hypothetical protein Cs7R123_04700 [Catellatospora sp. TT07R-123]